MRLAYMLFMSLTGDSSTIAAGSVIIVVHSTGQAFAVPLQALLRSCGLFCQAATEQPSAVKPFDVLYLPIQDTESFSIYIHWLKRGLIPTKTSESSARAAYLLIRTREQWTILFRLYILGQQLMDIAFQDTIIDAMIADALDMPRSRIVSLPTLQQIEFLWANTEDKAPARTLIQQLIVCADQGADFANDFNKQEYFVMMKSYVNPVVIDVKMVRENAVTCVYHAHDAGEGCFRDEMGSKKVKV